MDCLVEVHDKAELDQALTCGASIVGINNRNLQTFQVSLETSLALSGDIPSQIIRVSESGIRSAADSQLMADAGFDAILVGEALMRSMDLCEILPGGGGQ